MMTLLILGSFGLELLGPIILFIGLFIFLLREKRPKGK